MSRRHTLRAPDRRDRPPLLRLPAAGGAGAGAARGASSGARVGAVAPERCAGCGRAIDGGTAACRAEFDAACAFDFGGGVPWELHRLMVDAYALQHPDDFCASGKSLAAHLAGALAGIEHDGRRAVHRALRDRLDGPRDLERPDAPADRGGVTIAALAGADSP